MNSYQPPSTAMDKWQSVKHIIDQHPILPQPNLSRQFRKLRLNRLLMENILIFLIQYLGFNMSPVSAQAISPFWFFSGTACGFIFIRGPSILPGIFFGGLVSYFFIANSIISATIFAVIYSLQAFLLLRLQQNYISPTLIFYTHKEFIKFLFLASMITASACDVFTFFLYSDLRFEIWLPWWLANFNGILVFACAIVTWDFYFAQIDSLKNINKLTLIFSYVCLLCVGMFLLFSNTFYQILFFSLATFPLIIFISIKFGWCGIIAAVFLLGLLINFGAYFSAPLFTIHFSWTTLIFVQLMLLIESILGFFLAISFEEKYLSSMPVKS